MKDFSDQFSSSECTSACWNGIEPGISIRNDVEEILGNLQTGFNLIELPSGTSIIYEFSVPISRGDVYALVLVTNDVVTQITLPIEACISSIVSSYGEPLEVFESDQYYYLVYWDDGIVFSTSEYDSLSLVSAAFIIDVSVSEDFQYGEKLEWKNVKEMFDGDCKKHDV